MASISLLREVSPARLNREDPYLRLHAVNIYVRDLDRSLRFYTDQLGFHLALDKRLQTGQRLLAVAPPDGTGVLRLIAPSPDSQSYNLIGKPTQLVFLTEDVVAKIVKKERMAAPTGFLSRQSRHRRSVRRSR